MPGISEVLMSHYNYTAHCEWKLKEIKIDLQNEFSLGPLLEGRGARRVEQCCTWTPTQRLSVVLGLRLSMVADLGDGWLIDKQRIHGIYSGGEDSCCLWLECVDCAAFAGNKMLWVSSGYPRPHSWSLCNSLWQFVLCWRLWLRGYLSSWLTPPIHPSIQGSADWLPGAPWWMTIDTCLHGYSRCEDRCRRSGASSV